MPAFRTSVPVIITNITTPAIFDITPRIASVQDCSPAFNCALISYIFWRRTPPALSTRPKRPTLSTLPKLSTLPPTKLCLKMALSSAVTRRVLWVLRKILGGNRPVMWVIRVPVMRVVMMTVRTMKELSALIVRHKLIVSSLSSRTLTPPPSSILTPFACSSLSFA